MAELESTIGIYKVSHMPPSELRNLKRQVLLHEVILLLLIEYSNMLSITFYVFSPSTHRIPPTTTTSQLGTKFQNNLLFFTFYYFETQYSFPPYWFICKYYSLKPEKCLFYNTTTANVFTHLSVLLSSVFSIMFNYYRMNVETKTTALFDRFIMLKIHFANPQCFVSKIQ